jgi:hypothetical protein
MPKNRRGEEGVMLVALAGSVRPVNALPKNWHDLMTVMSELAIGLSTLPGKYRNPYFSGALSILATYFLPLLICIEAENDLQWILQDRWRQYLAAKLPRRT